MKPKLHIDYCTHKASAYAVKHWHYSRKHPTGGRLVRFGVWEDGSFRGAVVFGSGNSPYLLTKYGLKQGSGCELVRIALRSHATPVSRIVSICLKLLRRDYPRIRLLLSFADPQQGHHGGIYQAMNWLYLGHTKPAHVWVAPDGSEWHPRTISKSGWVRNGPTGYTKSTWKQGQCYKRPVPAKHKYAYPLDEAMRRKLLPYVQPYPSASEASVVDAPGDQPEEGGSNPTRTHAPEAAA